MNFLPSLLSDLNNTETGCLLLIKTSAAIITSIKKINFFKFYKFYLYNLSQSSVEPRVFCIEFYI